MRPLASFLLALALSTGPSLSATPPAQPKAGLPGGQESPDAEIVRKSVGRAGGATFVFHLAGQPAQPRPVVVLLHGWGATNPSTYGGWIDHLVRRGYLVLFPAFQEVGKTRPADATTVASGLVAGALAALSTDPAAKPDPTRLAYLGHSAGAGIGINLAALARSAALPVPKLVFAVMPGGIASDAASRGIQLADLGQLDPATAVVTMVGDREFQASDRVSRRILREATEVPVTRKLFVRAGSDDHGFPTLSATLASPASPLEVYDSAAIKVEPEPPVDRKAPRAVRPKWSADMVLTGEQTVLVAQLGRNPMDTLDFLAFWKTYDMVADSVLGGSGDLAALRADPAFLDMGRWSDGWPVRRLTAETPKPHDPAASAAAAPSARPAAAKPPPSARMPVTRQRQSDRR